MKYLLFTEVHPLTASARHNAKELRRSGIEVEEHDLTSRAAERHFIQFGPCYVLVGEDEKEYWRFPGHVGLEELKSIHQEFSTINK